jgi:hypothetical protein
MCGINFVQATVSYTPGGIDRKLSSISAISIRRAAMYAKPLIKMMIMVKLKGELHRRDSHFSCNMPKAEEIERDTDDHNTARHALRHNSCSVWLRNGKFQPMQCIPPNTIALKHPMKTMVPS